MKLLEFLLETTIREEPGSLKETYIGSVFYGRSASYNPQVDSIVRVNVNRLRHRLQEFYAGEGAKHPVRILIPRGMYEPTITDQVPAAQSALTTAFADPEHVPSVVSTDESPSDLEVHSNNKQQLNLSQQLRTSLWLGLTAGAFLLPFVLMMSLFRTRYIEVGGKFYRQMFSQAPVFATTRLQSFPLTMGAELEFEPSTTADGKSLAYISRRHGSHRFQIFLRRDIENGQTDQPLDTGSQDALYPAWSPNAKQIAFLRCGIGPCDIAIVSSAGGLFDRSSSCQPIVCLTICPITSSAS